MLFPQQDAHAMEVALDAMPVGVSWANLSDQKIVFVNRTFTEIFGYTHGDFLEIKDWIHSYPFPEDRALAEQRWEAYFDTQGEQEFHIEPMELRIRCKNGAIKTVINSGIILPQTGWALAIFVDISDRKREELLLLETHRQVREGQAIYRLLLDHSPEMILLWPFDSSRRYVSPAVLEVTGFTGEEYLALEPEESLHPDDFALVQQAAGELRAGKTSRTVRYRALQKTGGYRWVEANLLSYADPDSGNIAGYVATIRDIADQVDRELIVAAEHRRLIEAASRDELTGIANRRAFNVSLRHEGIRQSRSQRELSLLILDVDCFKQYNDRYGHLAGDACLRQVAQAIEGASRESDSVARYGGEEFAIILPATDTVGAEIIARRLLQAVSGLGIKHLDSPHGVVTVSIGIATWPAGSRVDQALLMECADRALYLAKAAGRNTFRVNSPA